MLCLQIKVSEYPVYEMLHCTVFTLVRGDIFSQCCMEEFYTVITSSNELYVLQSKKGNHHTKNFHKGD